MKLRLTAILLVFMLLCGCSAKQQPSTAGSQPAASGSSQAAGELLPPTLPPQSENPSLANFKTMDLEGNEVTQELFADYEMTVINIWATFCGPCLQEMPDLGALSAEYRDKGVQIVGVVSDVLDANADIDPKMYQTALEIVEKTGADYPHLLPSADLIYAGLLGVQAVPATVFVDSEGNLIGKGYLGAHSKEQWEQIIAEKLEEKDALSSGESASQGAASAPEDGQ